jgi:hypothetical protein
MSKFIAFLYGLVAYLIFFVSGHAGSDFNLLRKCNFLASSLAVTPDRAFWWMQAV